MTLHYPTDEISLSLLKKDFTTYSWETFRQDACSGISVALLTVPQAMAYALLAGLPLSCGLFAAMYATILAALFGSSRHLVAGPNTALSILIQAGTAEILFTYYRDLSAVEREIVAVEVLTQLTFLTAVLQILAAWCRLGRLTQFVSHSVVVGYIAGAALAIIISQLFVFLGISRLSGAHSLYEQAVYLVTHISQIQWPTAVIGLGAFILIALLKRMNRKIPAAVIAFIAAGWVVEEFGLSSYSGSSWIAHYLEDFALPNVMVIGDTGEVYDLIPNIGIPFLNMRIMNGVLPTACAIALLSMMESISVAKSIAAVSGQRLSINQEIFGIGLGNLLSAFIGGMPISGSPSRTYLNYSNGAQTRFAAVFSAVFVTLIIFAFGFFVTRIPLAALAALLLVNAAYIVNTRQLMLCLRATSADAFVLWTTLLSCIFFSLDIAFYIGVASSITLYLKKAAIPQLVEYDIDDAGELKNVDPTTAQEHKTIRVIKVEGELFFGSADLFQYTLKAMAEDDADTRVLILQLKNARDIDATTCLALQQLQEYLHTSGRHMIACGLTPPIWEVLNNSGLVELIGKDNLFLFDGRHPHQHMQKAIHRAKELATGIIAIRPAFANVAEPQPLPNQTS